MNNLGYTDPLLDSTMRYIYSLKKILVTTINYNRKSIFVVGLVTLVAIVQQTNLIKRTSCNIIIFSFGNVTKT